MAIAGFVPEDVPLVVGSLVDRAAIDEALDGRDVSGVVHLAGFKYAGVSVSRPLHTYTQNVTGTVVLLEGMAAHGVERIVFSSSAAVYGTPDTDLVTEESPTRPESPYGESKLIGEWLLRDQAKATDAGPHVAALLQRGRLGHPGAARHQPAQPVPDHLRPLVAGKIPYINGDDYPTADGTCIRDYVHVADLAASHVAAAKVLDAGGTLEPVYNLGSGDGLSVRQIMEAAARVTGIDFTADVKPRRPGDPAIIVAEGRLAARDIDWQMRHTVDDMVRSAWEAREAAL